MNYNLRTPCDECPFLEKMRAGFKLRRLLQFAQGEFPCHKACNLTDEGTYEARNAKTPHCAGALIFNELHGQPHQMMRISERLRLYDHTKLDLNAPVRKMMDG